MAVVLPPLAAREGGGSLACLERADELVRFPSPAPLKRRERLAREAEPEEAPRALRELKAERAPLSPAAPRRAAGLTVKEELREEP